MSGAVGFRHCEFSVLRQPPVRYPVILRCFDLMVELPLEVWLYNCSHPTADLPVVYRGAYKKTCFMEKWSYFFTHPNVSLRSSELLFRNLEKYLALSQSRYRDY